MKKIILLLLILSGCRGEVQEQNFAKKYLKWVGDIVFDPKLDDQSFTLCNEEEKVMQYFNNSGGVEYKGEKIALIKAFEKQFKPNQSSNGNGLLRVRFIVNCSGRTGRFRVLGMNENYQEKQFDSNITDQILSITKSLDGWKPKQMNGTSIDYYQHLIFKIQEGKITDILP